MAKTASDILKELSLKVRKVTEVESKTFDFLLDEIPMRIIRRTLLGKDINNNALKSLSASYILARKGFLKGEASFMARVDLSKRDMNKIVKGTFNKKTKLTSDGGKLKLISFKASGLPTLSSDAKPAKSNLTLTGEMLSSIVGKRSGNIFTFSFGSNTFANDKARWAKEGGRPFFGLSETDKKGLTTKISSIFRQILRDNFKG